MQKWLLAAGVLALAGSASTRLSAATYPPVTYEALHHFAEPRPSILTLPDYPIRRDTPTPTVDRSGGLTADDLARAFPKKARNAHQNGAATVECRVSILGENKDCVTLWEAPEGLGFGDAAVRLAGRMHMRPATKDGAPIGGAMIRIPIPFTAFADAPAVRAYVPPLQVTSAAAGTYEAPPERIATMGAPSGRLGLVGVRSDRGAFFVALDGEVKSGAKVQFDLLDIVFGPPGSRSFLVMRGNIVELTRYSVDCSAKAAQQIGTVFLDADARVSGWTIPEDRHPYPWIGQPFSLDVDSPPSLAAKKVCDGSRFDVEATSLPQALDIAIHAH